MKKILIIMVMIIGSLNAKSIDLDCNGKYVNENLHKIVSDKDIKKITNIEVGKYETKCNVKYFSGDEKDFIIKIEDDKSVYTSLIY